MLVRSQNHRSKPRSGKTGLEFLKIGQNAKFMKINDLAGAALFKPYLYNHEAATPANYTVGKSSAWAT